MANWQSLKQIAETWHDLFSLYIVFLCLFNQDIIFKLIVAIVPSRVLFIHPGNKSRSQSAKMSGRWNTKYGVNGLIN